jgi:hypothetical protein
VADDAPIDMFCTGGTAPSTTSTVWELAVHNDPEIAGTIEYARLNAGPAGCEVHYTYPIAETYTFQVRAGSTVTFRHEDANCTMIPNCGAETAFYSSNVDCITHARTIPGITLPPLYQGQPYPAWSNGPYQPLNGQLVRMQLLSVAPAGTGAGGSGGTGSGGATGSGGGPARCASPATAVIGFESLAHAGETAPLPGPYVESGFELASGGEVVGPLSERYLGTAAVGVTKGMTLRRPDGKPFSLSRLSLSAWNNDHPGIVYTFVGTTSVGAQVRADVALTTGQRGLIPYDLPASFQDVVLVRGLMNNADTSMYYDDIAVAYCP